MIKKESQVAIGIDTDTAADKRKEGTAYNIQDMEVDNNRGLMSLSIIKGQTLFIGTGSIVTIHATVEIDAKLFMLTSNSSDSDKVRVMYYNEATSILDTILTTDLVFNNPNRQVDLIANKENENIIKLYWAYEGEQLCNFNVFDSSYFGGSISATTEFNPRNIKPASLFSPQFINKLDGGNLVSGRIQYAYTLFNLGGVETVLSPLSSLISISKDGAGEASGEVVPISIDIILYPSSLYEYIRVYSIHYEELNQTPTIKLIAEREQSNPMHIIDDGNLFLGTLSLEELLFLGGTLITPKTIATKNNILFAGNYKNTSFDIEFLQGRAPAANTDCRVYMFHGEATPTAAVEHIDPFSYKYVVAGSGDYVIIPEDYDAVCPDYGRYKFTEDGVTPGAEGSNFRFEFITKDYLLDDNAQSLKQGEIYRIGCVWYDEYMRPAPVKWMIDIMVPRYDDYDSNIGLDINFIGDITDFTSLGAVSYQIVIAERQPRDRTISAQGILNPGADYFWSDVDGTPAGDPAADSTLPYYTLKRIAFAGKGGDIGVDFTSLVDIQDTGLNSGNKAALPKKRDDIQFFYSSDTVLDPQNMQAYTGVKITDCISTADVGDSNTRLRVFEGGGIKGTKELAGLHYITPTNTFPGTPFPDFMLEEYEEVGALHNSEHILSHRYETVEAAAEPQDITLAAPTLALNANSSDRIDNTKVSTSIDLPKMIFTGFTGGTGNEYFNSYRGSMANCQVLKFSDTSWHMVDGIGSPYNVFKDASALLEAEAALPIVELTRAVPNQYGGPTYLAKQRTTYLLKGEICVLNYSPNKVHYLGDVFLGPLIINRHDGLDSRESQYSNLYDYVYGPNVEHNLDVNARNDLMLTWESGLGTGLLGSYRLDDNHQLASGYRQKENLKVAVSKPALFRDVSNFETSIIASHVKTPNEAVDSWTSFQTAEVLDLQGTYGELNKLYNFKNEIYSFQNTGVAHILIQPNTQIQTSSSIQVELGTGAILYDADYVNTKSGTVAMKGIADDGHSLLYYDNVTNSVNTLAGEELSTSKFITGLMLTLVPANPRLVNFVYSINRHEFVMAFNKDDKQLIYNTLLQSFQRTQLGYGFIFSYNNMLHHKVNNGSTSIYTLFGGVKRTKGYITYLFAPEPKADKVFHFLEFRPRGTITLDKITVTGNASQATGVLDTPKQNTKFGIVRVHLPRIDGKRERFRDTGIKVDLEISSNDPAFLDEMTIMYNTKG